ncbi:hypothetical protein SBOR_8899 [Sclerotinia borealis F-4128]|uniref:Uncharacterized protein n=1 Tax=Sclerotinia borealis (strain F-4128) TaxID=1432307 RepID=W9C7Z9_SCLBF|nr:hypothetical protein SBOR_8899 [Sclerotinia borealis F-4128]
MASQVPPDGPGRGISQLYPTAPVSSMKSQAPPADAPARGVSQLYPSGNPSQVQILGAPSKVPSAAPRQSHHPSVRPFHAATLRAPSQSPPHHPSTRPSHAATLRAPTQSPSHHPSITPSHAAALRIASQAPHSYTSARGISQYTTAVSKKSGREPSAIPIMSMSTNVGATELKRDASINYYRQPTIILQSPSDQNTQYQRDTVTFIPRQSAQPTLLQRDHSKIPPAISAIMEARITPIIGPSKKFENLPSARSILHSKIDIQMASRQSTINELQGAERAAQDEWALGKLGKLNTGCPQNYGWSRRGDGYLCDGGSHYITDKLLCEGMGGLFVVKDKNDWQNRSEGVYYWAGKNEQGKNLFKKIKSPEFG